MTPAEFATAMNDSEAKLTSMFDEGRKLETLILQSLSGMYHDS